MRVTACGSCLCTIVQQSGLAENIISKLGARPNIMNVVVSMLRNAVQRMETFGVRASSFPTQCGRFVWVRLWSASGASAAATCQSPLGGLFDAGSLLRTARDFTYLFSIVKRTCRQSHKGERRRERRRAYRERTIRLNGSPLLGLERSRCTSFTNAIWLLTLACLLPSRCTWTPGGDTFLLMHVDATIRERAGIAEARNTGTSCRGKCGNSGRLSAVDGTLEPAVGVEPPHGVDVTLCSWHAHARRTFVRAACVGIGGCSAAAWSANTAVGGAATMCLCVRKVDATGRKRGCAGDGCVHSLHKLSCHCVCVAFAQMRFYFFKVSRTTP